MTNSYNEERRKLYIKLARLESKLVVTKIREAIAKREREATTSQQLDRANPITPGYHWVKKWIGADNINFLDYMRAVEEMTRTEYGIPGAKIAMFPVKPPEKGARKIDKERWLFELNCHIEAFFSPDVELVWKKKS